MANDLNKFYRTSKYIEKLKYEYEIYSVFSCFLVTSGDFNLGEDHIYTGYQIFSL
jgi:hypothetical protein